LLSYLIRDSFKFAPAGKNLCKSNLRKSGSYSVCTYKFSQDPIVGPSVIRHPALSHIPPYLTSRPISHPALCHIPPYLTSRPISQPPLSHIPPYLTSRSISHPALSHIHIQRALFIISGFRCEAEENCALLGYYAAYSGNSLPTFRYNLSVLIFLFLILEDGTKRLSRNVCKELPVYLA